MIKTLLVAGTAFGLVVAAGAASAGPCSTEIDTLQKQLSSTDAGMGPTGTGEVAETSNLHPPTDTMNQATEGKAASPGDVAAQNTRASRPTRRPHSPANTAPPLRRSRRKPRSSAPASSIRPATRPPAWKRSIS